LALIALALIAAAPATADSVIIRAAKPYDKLVAAIEKNGGTVTYQYRFVDGIAAEVPAEKLDLVRSLVAPGAVRKDFLVEQPRVASDRDGSPLLAETDSVSATAIDATSLAGLATEQPGAYVINNTTMNLDSIHAGGIAGAGIKVAVIDSGYRPGFPHIDLDGSVIGGEDLVGDGLGYANFANDGHGTFVAGMISSNVIFGFNPAGTLFNSIATHCPSCVLLPNGVPMIGSAPLSSVYAVRVFGPVGGAPESRIIAAMEQVLALRENFDNGVPETQNPDGSFQALEIKVCNMSLGGPTLYAGRDFEDQLTQAFLDRDIVLVTSAGNEGPSGSTGGSPGTGFGSLTVGASSSAVHERILRDLQFGPGIGVLYRPSPGTQTATFSSRGPTADGRVDPELVASGHASFGQGFASATNFINIASGTSFSSPSVAGVAALLREAVPGATARQVRNALIMSADPTVLVDGSGPLDQGSGHVDGAAALALLQAGGVPDTPGVSGGTNPSVKVNIQQGAGVETYDGNVTRSVQGLLPGQRFETYYRTSPNTSAVVVNLFDFNPGPVENVFFGNDILFAIHSAKTHPGGNGDYEVVTFSTGGTFLVPNPENGLLRITATGDWTNTGPVDVSVNIFSLHEATPGLTAQGKLTDGEFELVPFTVPAGATNLAVRLAWKDNYGRYPTNDLDVILVDPIGGVHFDGATLDAPEVLAIASPLAGDWLAFIDAFPINDRDDRYELLVEVE
jgi:hypothetical protein